MQGIKDDLRLELQLAVTGTHLIPAFGSTYREIESDGFSILREITLELSQDTPVGISKSVAQGVAGFAEALDQLRPDIVVVLGDRFETFAAAQAAMFAGIPIAHLNGGELTEGVIDEAIRHSITKMAHFHFASTESYRRRIVQLGEDPEHVWNVGSTGVDSIRRLNLLTRGELGAAISFDVSRPYFVVTYHPVTLADDDGVTDLILALQKFPDHSIIFTGVNADIGRKAVAEKIEQFARSEPSRVLTAPSLGQLRYLSAMKYADAVIGNSSSGIIEAPSFGVPTVNIGARQRGRMRADSVIDVEAHEAEIVSAIARATSPEFKAVAGRALSLFGDGRASDRIVQILANCDLRDALMKKFFDLP